MLKLTSVWNGHLRHRQSVHHIAALVCDVVYDQAFTLVEAHVEAPFLPVNHIALRLERRALWLGDDVRLQIVAKWGLQEIVSVLHCFHGLPRGSRSAFQARARGKVVDSNELSGHAVKYR